MKKLIILTAILLCAPAYPTERGDVAPSFESPELFDNGTVALADYAGKVVLIDFWASWCAPCRDSLPLLSRLHAALVDRGFEVLAINIDEDLDDGRRFLTTYPVGYTVLSDQAGGVAKSYGLTTMPTSFLVDRRGIVRYVHKGFDAGDIEKIRAQTLRILDEL